MCGVMINNDDDWCAQPVVWVLDAFANPVQHGKHRVILSLTQTKDQVHFFVHRDEVDALLLCCHSSI